MIQLQQELEAHPQIEKQLEFFDHYSNEYRSAIEFIELPNFTIDYRLKIEQWGDQDPFIEVSEIEVHTDSDRIDFTLDLEKMIIDKIEVI